MNKQQVIHVVYTTDSAFFVPACVSLYSLCDNAAKDRKIIIHLLVNSSITCEDIIVLKNIGNLFPNITIDVMTVDDLEYKTTIPRISGMTYQRLFLCEYLTEADKVLYLDSDTIITGDIAEVYDYPMNKNHYISGAVHFNNTEKYSSYIGLSNKLQYLNAGVLLMNLKKMRSDNLQRVFERLLSVGYWCQDQDVINIACYGKKTLLPIKFNFEPNQLYWSGVRCLELVTRKEIQEGIKKPVIIHFWGDKKPWDDTRYDWHGIWYDYFVKLCNMLPSFYDTQKEIQNCEQHCHEQIRVIEDDKLIFYGAGACASRLLGQINLLNAGRPDVIWDREADNIGQLQDIIVEIPQFDSAGNKEKTVFVICVDNEETRLHIADDIKSKGFARVYEAHEYSMFLWERYFD